MPHTGQSTRRISTSSQIRHDPQSTSRTRRRLLSYQVRHTLPQQPQAVFFPPPDQGHNPAFWDAGVPANPRQGTESGVVVGILDMLNIWWIRLIAHRSKFLICAIPRERPSHRRYKVAGARKPPTHFREEPIFHFMIMPDDEGSA